MCKNALVTELIRWNASYTEYLENGEVDLTKTLFNPELTDFLYEKDFLNYTQGSSVHIFKLFQLVAADLIHLHTVPWNEVCPDGPNSETIKRVLTKVLMENNDKQVVFVHLPNYIAQKCKDKTLLQEVKHLQGYTLQSAVFSKGYHATAAALCNGQYVLYDNEQSNRPRLETKKNERKHFKADELMFVFLKGAASAASAASSSNASSSNASSPEAASPEAAAASASSPIRTFSQSPTKRRRLASPIVISSSSPPPPLPIHEIITVSSSSSPISGGRKTRKENHLKKKRKTQKNKKMKSSKSFLSRLLKW